MHQEPINDADLEKIGKGCLQNNFLLRDWVARVTFHIFQRLYVCWRFAETFAAVFASK